MATEYYTKARNADFYQKLRSKMRKWEKSSEGRKARWMEYLLLAPDLFHLLTRLVLDKEVGFAMKSKLSLVILYFISPIDLIPEALLGPGGYIDDIVLSAYVINLLINETNPAIVYKHWAGEGDILEILKKITKHASSMVGTKTWSKLRNSVR
jgi:uncharacterized membrane protein YkvA (DUF1232 family)